MWAKRFQPSSRQLWVKATWISLLLLHVPEPDKRCWGSTSMGCTAAIPFYWWHPAPMVGTTPSSCLFHCLVPSASSQGLPGMVPVTCRWQHPMRRAPRPCRKHLLDMLWSCHPFWIDVPPTSRHVVTAAKDSWGQAHFSPASPVPMKRSANCHGHPLTLQSHSWSSQEIILN